MTRWFPELAVVSALWVEARRRVHDARTSDRGASALEWAIIAAIVGAAAVALGVVITNKVTQKGQQVGGL
jgi:hypothetical protein